MSNIQNVGANNGGGVSATLVINAGAGWVASTAGSAIVLTISYKFQGTNGNQPSSITDSASQTWPAALFTGLQNAADGIETRTYVFPNSASITSLTITFPGNTWVLACASEESVIATSNAVDQFNTGNQSTVSVWTTANITTTVANDVCYGNDCNSSASSQTMAVTGSWALLSGTGIASGIVKNLGFGWEHIFSRQVLSGTATLAATGTTSASVSALSTVLSLKPFISGGPTKVFGQNSPTSGGTGNSSGGSSQIWWSHNGNIA